MSAKDLPAGTVVRANWNITEIRFLDGTTGDAPRGTLAVKAPGRARVRIVHRDGRVSGWNEGIAWSRYRGTAESLPEDVRLLAVQLMMESAK